MQRFCRDYYHISQYVQAGTPTLYDIAAAYSDSSLPIALTDTYIRHLNTLLNMPEQGRMNDMQIEDCATQIYRIARLHNLTVAELHEFFNRVRSGTYVEFFGSIDTDKICRSLRLYVNELISVRRAIENNYRREQDRCKELERSKNVASTHKPVDQWFADEPEPEWSTSQPIISSSLKRRGIL